jgi:hypothetical protein
MTAVVTAAVVFIAIRTGRVIPGPAHPSAPLLRIGMGMGMAMAMARFATLPDGTYIGPLPPQETSRLVAECPDGPPAEEGVRE